jgi:hypothetical protein
MTSPMAASSSEALFVNVRDVQQRLDGEQVVIANELPLILVELDDACRTPFLNIGLVSRCSASNPPSPDSC